MYKSVLMSKSNGITSIDVQNLHFLLTGHHTHVAAVVVTIVAQDNNAGVSCLLLFMNTH